MFRIRFTAAIGAAALLGCVARRAPAGVEPSARAAGVPRAEASGESGPAAGSVADRVLAGPDLAVEDAVAVALTRHPGLAVAGAEIAVAEARGVGAALYPNPSATVEVADEEVESGFRPRLWVEIEQPIVLSDRRQLGADAARAAADAAAYDRVSLEIDVVAAVRAAFHEVLAAGAVRDLADANAAAASDAVRVAEDRLEAQRATELDVLRARAEDERARVASAVAAGRLEGARARLLGAMGVPEGPLPPCRPVGGAPPPLPPVETLESGALESHPAVLAARARLRSAEIGLDEAEAIAVPDLTVAAGYGAGLDPFANLWTVSLGMPIPVFDRNQGGRAEAEAAVVRAAADLARVEVGLRAALRESVAERDGAAAALDAIRDRLAPVVAAAYGQAEIGWREGRTDYLTLLDARRARAEAQAAEIEASLALWIATIRVEALVGPIEREEESP